MLLGYFIVCRFDVVIFFIRLVLFPEIFETRKSFFELGAVPHTYFGDKRVYEAERGGKTVGIAYYVASREEELVGILGEGRSLGIRYGDYIRAAFLGVCGSGEGVLEISWERDRDEHIIFAK